MRSLSRFFAVVFFSSACGTLLHASPLIDDFVFQGGGVTATFSLPASPTPSLSDPDNFFEIPNITTSAGGESVSGPVDFFVDADGGGAAWTNADLSGPQLFSGTTDAPTFLLGSFFLTGTYDLGDGPTPISGTLTISPEAPVGTTIPEPGSWLLLGTGATASLGLVRRRIFR